MIFLDILGLIAQAAIIFVASTFIFDAVHFMLHKWAKSSIPLLRTFSAWHNVHHKFLDENMNVNPAWVKANFWAHLVPEFATSILGTVIFLPFFHWIPVTVILIVHVWMFVDRLREEGIDFNHMSMDRVNGQIGLWQVNPNYHALHHIYPDNYYSSFVNVFDLVFGTTCKIKKRRFLVTGANGAYGKAMVERIEKMDGIVTTAKHGIDFAPGDYERMREKLENTDVLVLAHGSKSEDCWNANFRTPVDLIELFMATGTARLVPPEVWGVGSEVELHGDMGMDSLKAYSASKRAFAAKALDFFLGDDVIYRHIVPSAFTSSMGRGPMSANTAAAITMFFIRRGFKYVPVTFTTLAFWNYFRFIAQPRDPARAFKWGPVQHVRKFFSAAFGGRR